MDFAGIGGEEQYKSSLEGNVAVRTNFPKWAYADELVKAHAGMQKAREGKRDRVEFVSGRKDAEMAKDGAAPAKKKSRFDR